MNKNGFTLIELIVVLTLIGLISLLVLPVLTDSLNRLSMKTSLKEMAATMRRARSLAVSHKKNYTFHLNTIKKEYYITGEVPDLSENAKVIKLNNKRINDEVTIKGFLQYGSDSIEEKETISIIFYPGGNSSGGKIMIRNRSGESEHTILADKISGRIIIEDGVEP